MKVITFNKENECDVQDGVVPASIIYYGRIDKLKTGRCSIILEEKVLGHFGLMNREINFELSELLLAITTDKNIILIKE